MQQEISPLCERIVSGELSMTGRALTVCSRLLLSLQKAVAQLTSPL